MKHQFRSGEPRGEINAGDFGSLLLAVFLGHPTLYLLLASALLFLSGDWHLPHENSYTWAFIFASLLLSSLFLLPISLILVFVLRARRKGGPATIGAIILVSWIIAGVVILMQSIGENDFRIALLVTMLLALALPAQLIPVGLALRPRGQLPPSDPQSTS